MCERAFIFITVLFFIFLGGGEKLKKHVYFHDRFEGRENLKIYIFTTVVLGEKIKKFLFSLPFFGRENKNLIFTTFEGGEKIKKYFVYSRPFLWENLKNNNFIFTTYWGIEKKR